MTYSKSTISLTHTNITQSKCSQLTSINTLQPIEISIIINLESKKGGKKSFAHSTCKAGWTQK